ESISACVPIECRRLDLDLRSFGRRKIRPCIFMRNGAHKLLRELKAVVAIGHDDRAITVEIGNELAPESFVCSAVHEVSPRSAAAEHGAESLVIGSGSQHDVRHGGG